MGGWRRAAGWWWGVVWACCWVVEWTRSARLGGLVPACPAAVRRNTCPTGARQHNPTVDNPLCKAVGRTAAVVGGGRPPDFLSSALAKLRCRGPGAHQPAWLPMRVRGAELAPTRPPPPRCACRVLGGLLQGPGASRVACLGASANASAAHAGRPSDAPSARRSSPRCPPLAHARIHLPTRSHQRNPARVHIPPLTTSAARAACCSAPRCSAPKLPMPVQQRDPKRATGAAAQGDAGAPQGSSCAANAELGGGRGSGQPPR